MSGLTLTSRSRASVSWLMGNKPAVMSDPPSFPVCDEGTWSQCESLCVWTVQMITLTEVKCSPINLWMHLYLDPSDLQGCSGLLWSQAALSESVLVPHYDPFNSLQTGYSSISALQKWSSMCSPISYSQLLELLLVVVVVVVVEAEVEVEA